MAQKREVGARGRVIADCIALFACAASGSVAARSCFLPAVSIPLDSKPAATQSESGKWGKNVRAFLDTIAWAEGTSGKHGYRIQYTGALFRSYSDHPRRINCAPFRGRPLCSDAAGRYQFLSTTWDPLASALRLPDFSPASQDRAAVETLRRLGALEAIRQGNFDRAVALSASTWASLPKAGSPESYGISALGQSAHSRKKLRTVYLAAGGRLSPSR